MHEKALMHNTAHATKFGQNLQPRQKFRRKNTKIVSKIETKLQPTDNSISTDKNNGNQFMALNAITDDMDDKMETLEEATQAKESTGYSQ